MGNRVRTRFILKEPAERAMLRGPGGSAFFLAFFPGRARCSSVGMIPADANRKAISSARLASSCLNESMPALNGNDASFPLSRVTRRQPPPAHFLLLHSRPISLNENARAHPLPQTGPALRSQSRDRRTPTRPRGRGRAQPVRARAGSPLRAAHVTRGTFNWPAEAAGCGGRRRSHTHAGSHTRD